MNVVFFGTPSFVIPVLQKLYDTETTTVVGVVSVKDSPIWKQAQRTGTPVHTLSEYNDENIEPDINIVSAYGKILSKDIIHSPPLSSLNIHPSLLPDLRGPSPVKTAILKGYRETGVTIIKMDEKMDHGPIVAQKKVSLNQNETALELTEQLFSIGVDMLIHVLPQWKRYKQGESYKKRESLYLPPKEQAHNKATYTSQFTKQDGKIDWNTPELEIYNMVRAFNSWPSAWTTLEELCGYKGISLRDEHNPLTRVQITKSHISKNGDLIIDEVNVEGKSPQTWKAFLSGYT